MAIQDTLITKRDLLSKTRGGHKKSSCSAYSCPFFVLDVTVRGQPRERKAGRQAVGLFQGCACDIFGLSVRRSSQNLTKPCQNGSSSLPQGTYRARVVRLTRAKKKRPRSVMDTVAGLCPAHPAPPVSRLTGSLAPRRTDGAAESGFSTSNIAVTPSPIGAAERLLPDTCGAVLCLA